MEIPESKLVKSQKIKTEPREIQYYDRKAWMIVTLRYDDECGNGHNSFSITADIYTHPTCRGSNLSSCGCLHEEIERHFPEYSSVIKWHLTSSDGPMHYVANTKHLAGDRDCWGLRKGEPKNYEYFAQFGNSPIKHQLKRGFYKFLTDHEGPREFRVIPLAHEREPDTFKPQYTLIGYGEKWHECPFRLEREAREFCDALNTCDLEFSREPVSFGEGKERQLDAARGAACWPEATDEDLCSPDLENKLKERLPGLMIEFKKAMEGLGFTY